MEATEYNDPEWVKHVEPHKEWVELFPGRMWMIEGTLKQGTVRRNMVVYKMNDGGLWCHSVIALNEKSMKQMESWGAPTVYVIPNGQHSIDAGVWQKRYPECKLFCPLSFKPLVEKKQLKLAGICEESLESAAPGVKALKPDGFKTSGVGGLGGELVYEVSLDDNSTGLVFCDLLFNAPWMSGLKAFILCDKLAVARAVRWLGYSNGAKFKAFMTGLAEKQTTKVLAFAHGLPVTDNCPARLKTVADECLDW